MRIDLNADVGESYGDWRTDDATILRSVTSASVACGGHTGDAASMRRTVDLAAENGVSIGAHVSYADPEGFGRRAVQVGAVELAGQLGAQLAALQEVARAAGALVRYVKPHGALYGTRDADHASAVVRVVADAGLPVVALPRGEIARQAAAAGLRVVGEAFLDRGYLADGTLVPRTEAGAILHDVDEVCARAVSLVRDRNVVAVSGERIAVAAETLCLHGDTDGAASLLATVRVALEAAGVEVGAFV
ncbi:MAG TPA: 5-oxoprolinase subunit PxpA [Candidatus Nanopelagicales bacterium]|nr:5-oxoprolinase subunit PxpA [Candidatus Nanopelagicales bacterium]